MQIFRTVFGATALAAVCVAGVPSAMANSAIALGKCDWLSYAYGYGSLGETKANALNECASKGDSTCEIVVEVRSGCGAVAVSANCGSRGWAYAHSREESEYLAVGERVHQAWRHQLHSPALGLR